MFYLCELVVRYVTGVITVQQSVLELPRCFIFKRGDKISSEISKIPHSVIVEFQYQTYCTIHINDYRSSSWQTFLYMCYIIKILLVNYCPSQVMLLKSLLDKLINNITLYFGLKSVFENKRIQMLVS